MKINWIYLFVCFALLGLNACSKDNDDLSLADELGQSSSSPVFTFSANNGAINLRAGVSDYYMFTDFQNNEVNQTITFISTLAKLPNCQNNCNEALQIEISSVETVDAGSLVDVNSAIILGEYPYSTSNGNGTPGTVVVQYTNPNGIVFRSDLLDQNIESFFEIEEIENYQINENGYPTKRLSVSFNCVLRDTESSQEFSLSNANGVISIAYPE